ncbi:MAG: YhcN/YlaJ family sporulation lipoprotein [Thermicanus sp.]|nr:YhcN/YlaJ family sporulation lipoprotein [Thermicanus sp.]
MLGKLFLFIFLFFILLLGCVPENRPPANQSSPPKVAREQRVDQISYPNQTAERPENQNAQKVANRLVQLALQDPNVQDATAVVVGRLAVVGIDVADNLEAARVSTIKYSVAQSLKEDPLGANALVTSDPDLMERLREMARRIREGHPIAGVADELADIVARIMPQFPRQVEQREEPQTPENRRRLNQTTH